MAGFKVGILVDNLRLGVRPGIEKAAELGADGVQIVTTGGEVAPWNLSGSARRDLKGFIASKGLELSALCGDFGGGGFAKGDMGRAVRFLRLAIGGPG